MTAFELQTSGVRSNWSTCWATTTANGSYCSINDYLNLSTRYLNDLQERWWHWRWLESSLKKNIYNLENNLSLWHYLFWVPTFAIMDCSKTNWMICSWHELNHCYSLEYLETKWIIRLNVSHFSVPLIVSDKLQWPKQETSKRWKSPEKQIKLTAQKLILNQGFEGQQCLYALNKRLSGSLILEALNPKKLTFFLRADIKMIIFS